MLDPFQTLVCFLGVVLRCRCEPFLSDLPCFWLDSRENWPYHSVILVPRDFSESSHPCDPWRYTADTRKCSPLLWELSVLWTLNAFAKLCWWILLSLSCHYLLNKLPQISPCNVSVGLSHKKVAFLVLQKYFSSDNTTSVSAQATVFGVFYTFRFHALSKLHQRSSSLLKKLLLIIYSPPCHPRYPCLSFFSRKEIKVFDEYNFSI